MKQEFISHSTNETEEIAQKFAKMLEKSDFVALFGDLGVGKTAFVRGLAR
ncbi:MAG: tRNA (adenosine(37)-N6)-threonylcarbamoyltransferase complex ATPase subunit type 1 TsaE, partial [Clostridia bacterium]|nr:tRNA (adenosine(37)-N6)-threonylcarbamoyltransferase complex ATPase subunit type 1 TsaE [Clostridia bacterium]